MNRQEIITFYRNQGMAVIKLIGKRPVDKEWQKTTVHNLDAYSWKNDLGANLPNDIVVIDVDPRNFPKNSKGEVTRNPAIELFDACGIVKPKTLKVETGSGGIHIYFRKPPEVLCKPNLNKEGFPGIDIKTRNGEKGAYVVMPPSKHEKTKKEYKLRQDGDSIMDIPKLLLKIIEKEDPVETQINAVTRIEDYDNTNSAKILYVNWLKNKAPLAVEGENGDLTTYQVACTGRDYGLDMNNTYFCMLGYWNDRCSPPWDENELIKKVENAFQYATGSIGAKDSTKLLDTIDSTEEPIKVSFDFYKDSETLKKTLNNAVSFFELPATGLRNLLQYNEFSQKIEFRRKPPWLTYMVRDTWADEDVTACRYHLSSNFGFEVTATIINEAAQVQALKNRVHPVREYLEGLCWDGKPRLNGWLPKYAKTENSAFAREVGRKLLVGAVARIFEPGCKFDYVTVLEGNQGMYKSTLISVLGGEWYSEVDIDPKNKDIIHVMNGKWFIELSEMETTRKSEADALKSFITRQTDRLRLPYDRYATDVKRQCVFIGTINPRIGLGYLKDTTGNRRFWCLEVKRHCDVDGLREVRDQLFAEAVQVYRQGELLYLDKQDIDEIARMEADKRTGGDPWQTVIEKVLKTEQTNIEEITPIEIFKLALGGKTIDFSIRENTRIINAMKAIGWQYVIVEKDGRREGVFRRGGLL